MSMPRTQTFGRPHGTWEIVDFRGACEAYFALAVMAALARTPVLPAATSSARSPPNRDVHGHERNAKCALLAHVPPQASRLTAPASCFGGSPRGSSGIADSMSRRTHRDLIRTRIARYSSEYFARMFRGRALTFKRPREQLRHPCV